MEITREMEETYRKVRRYYAEEDVRGWLDDHECDPDEYEHLEELVDAYDRWQGCNEHWYDAIEDMYWWLEWDSEHRTN